ncbi:MAG TPA: hypothetical protein VMT00_04650 [Thermoanaerobaculia bacterium]|nr:hypothetical protein [Thermoanaerobaculia bacterium]
MPDPKANMRAAMLTGVLVTAPIEPAPFVLRNRPAIVHLVSGNTPPLDLDAPRFRYRVGIHGRIEPVAEGARRCRKAHRGLRG